MSVRVPPPAESARDRLLAELEIAPNDVAMVVHGTTLATNALIERRGAKVGFVTTEGFRDTLEMAYEHRYDQYDLLIDKPRPLVERALRQAGLNTLLVHEAGSGVEGLERLKEYPVDLILSDINMPRMDGLTLLGRLQEREDHLATVIVSAYGDMANIRTAMNRGAFDFVTKPIDFADLETTITKTLRNLAKSYGGITANANICKDSGAFAGPIQGSTQ